MLEPKEIHILDRNAEALGVPTAQLMESAGKDVADYVTDILGQEEKNILVLCGPGNNGGDGFVAARHLSNNNQVTVQLTCQDDEIHTKISQDNFKRLPPTVTTKTIEDIEEIDTDLANTDIIIDAMLGIGLSGELREPYRTIVEHINDLREHFLIISVDIPTGFGTDVPLQPQYTVTFHDSKTGMNEENCGTIQIADIGIPPEAETHLGPGDLTFLYPQSQPQSHKGDNGRVLIVGGGPYNGAPLLAGLAALRSGADLVHLFTPRRTYDAIKGYCPDLICHDLKSENTLTLSDIPLIIPYFQNAHALLIGPGLGEDKDTLKAVLQLITEALKTDLPLVIDADAIQVVGSLLSSKPDAVDGHKVIVTPHHQEYTKLTGDTLPDSIEDQLILVHQYAYDHHLCVLLKGPTDILSDGKHYKFNTIHHPAMTVGGTGDALAGITTTLLAKRMTPFKSIRISAYLNGSSGIEAFNEKNYGMTTTDLIESIPAVLIKHLCKN